MQLSGLPLLSGSRTFPGCYSSLPKSESLRLVSRITSEKCCFCQLNTKVVQTSSIDVGNSISADDSFLFDQFFLASAPADGKVIFQLHLKQRASLVISSLLKIVAREESCFL